MEMRTDEIIPAQEISEQVELCDRPNTNESTEAENEIGILIDEQVDAFFDLFRQLAEIENESATSQTAINSLNDILEKALSSYSSDGNIYRVPEPLRSMKLEAYAPTVISIGPFHSRRKDLMANSLKPIFLHYFLFLTNHTTTTIVEEVATWEERARGCYAEPIDMSSDEFVKLLVLDGCFVVMHLIGSQNPEFGALNTSDLWKFWHEIYYDLLLLENQLPFFLLQFLYHLFASSQQPVVLAEIASKVNHFVDLQRMHFTPTGSPEPCIERICWPPTATELHECGVIFRKGKDVAFEVQGGFLKLPQLNICDDFEKRMKNLIAYEQCHYAIDINNEVSNFAVFMQCLVQTDQDVKLLIDEGIIENNLGSIKEVTQLFNNLSNHVDPGFNSYNFSCEEMRKYCQHRRHRWMTSLHRNYFSTPWLCASSIGVILIVALTFIQAVVAIVALLKQIGSI